LGKVQLENFEIAIRADILAKDNFPISQFTNFKLFFYSLLNENSCAAALLDGIQDAINAMTNTVAPTKMKSITLSFTGK
jgi:hypothetical protein